jgi:hypothetical protein
MRIIISLAFTVLLFSTTLLGQKKYSPPKSFFLLIMENTSPHIIY